MNYIEAQFFKVAPFPLNEESQAEHLNGQIKLKVHSKRGETNWLNVTPEQFKLIEKILSREDLDPYDAYGVNTQNSFNTRN